MTANQIEYDKLLESIRSNRAQEALITKRDAETARANAMNEHIKLLGHQENVRSNLAKEEEILRSNLASEAETRRHNKSQEIELNRSNVARELETTRSNLANESIGYMNAATNAKNAVSNAMNAATQQYKADTERKTAMANVQHNNANLSYLQERLNREMGMKANEIALSGVAQKETERSHKANEDIAYSGQATGLLGSIANAVARAAKVIQLN